MWELLRTLLFGQTRCDSEADFSIAAQQLHIHNCEQLWLNMLLCPAYAQVQLPLVSAAVELFLKKPTGKPQAMIQLVLTYATQLPTIRTCVIRIHLLAPAVH